MLNAKRIKQIGIVICLLSVSAQAFTASYKCVDRKDGFELWVNIDENSFHYGDTDHHAIFSYDKTVKAENSTLVHFFSRKKVYYTVHQVPSNAIDIYIDDYKNNKIRYEYKCKLKKVLKNNEEIPVTWKTIDDAKKMLQKIAIEP